jgi:hypothetical protein
MASHWSGHITLKVIEAKVGYVVAGSSPDGGIGFLEVLGDAILARLSGTEEQRQNFHLSLTIHGNSAAQVKARATVWPRSFDEIAAGDGVIGIVLKADEYEHRRAEIFISASDFDRLVHSFSTSTAITLYRRERAPSSRDLIVSVHLNTTLIVPVASDN